MTIRKSTENKDFWRNGQHHSRRQGAPPAAAMALIERLKS
jgi:hypothetical protein